jgi:hypothetical protein
LRPDTSPRTSTFLHQAIERTRAPDIVNPVMAA